MFYLKLYCPFLVHKKFLYINLISCPYQNISCMASFKIFWCVLCLKHILGVGLVTLYLLLFLLLQCLGKILGKILQEVLPQILFQVLVLSYIAIIQTLHLLEMPTAAEYPIIIFFFCFFMSSNSEIIPLALPITDKLLRVILHFCYTAYHQHFSFFLRTLDSAYVIHSVLHAAYFLPSAF